MKQTSIGIVMVLAFWLGGCIHQEPYDLGSAEKTTLYIAQDALHMAGQQLTIVEASEYENAEMVYYAENELELVKILQYVMDQSQMIATYQSPQALDLTLCAHLLSIANPFDISLTQNEISYTDQNGNELYHSHQITIKRLEDRYELACQAAKERIDMIIDEAMSTEEKIAAIHHDIILHCIYEPSSQAEMEAADRSVYHASGVLLDGRGVCAGYSRAFMLMAQYAGIPALYVSSKEMNHGWNYVYNDNEWRFIDVTWDDPLPDRGDNIKTTYLSMDVDQFFADGTHTLSEEERTQVELIAASFFANL